ncbi:Beta-barrel assembly machine subunit BamD [Fontimonas thermophila]|uniref:Outer membrane protein assembly factor BamD n=1 Tax=Fontimonas thermophila TaxID=1076937 RepID=A0A1I2IA39_9GAMM|nr:outer membrane protein assembly factor BamD [Fontimonas thermophila]SFF38500.1 Beta-barrel assembly machine subunit BamD [Fontimonas thermophila]
MKSRIAAIAAVAAILVGCSADPDRPPPTNPFRPEQTSAREQRLQAAELYRLARRTLESNDFAGAIQRYSQLSLRFPFTDYAIQGQVEKIYALYRNYQPDEALAEADRFLRDYPRHEHVAYVQYIKGLVNFDRDRGLSDALGLDTVRRDTSNLRRAFDDFALLVQRYPQSPYVGDARARMIWLRNRLAAHELTIVEYYMRRGAYIAAAKRAEQIIAQYPGAPATLTALDLLAASYDALGLREQAGDARKLRQAYLATAPREILPQERQERRGFWSRWFGSDRGVEPPPPAG